MSSRLMPPKVGSSAAMWSISLSRSFSAISMSNTSMPANFLNSTPLPSITGLAASGPMAPSPRTAGPLVTTATTLGRAVSPPPTAGGARRQLRRHAGIAHDLVAGGRHARRIGEREVTLGGQRLGRDDLDLPGTREAMGAKRAFGQCLRQARLLASPTKRAARRRQQVTFPIEPASLVRPRRLELPRLAALAPQASASTNSAMAAPVRWGGGYQIGTAVARQLGR